MSKRDGLPEKSVCVPGEEIQTSAVVRWYEALQDYFQALFSVLNCVEQVKSGRWGILQKLR